MEEVAVVEKRREVAVVDEGEKKKEAVMEEVSASVSTPPLAMLVDVSMFLTCLV
jgi:hypothetical protein